MGNLSDAEKLDTIIKSLSMTANSFATKLEYSSSGSVYHVLNGKNNFSDGMRYRILEYFPQINANFMSDGELPVILTGPELQAQMNLLGVKSEKSKLEGLGLERFLEIPQRLERIEKLLEILVTQQPKSNEEI